MKYEMGIDVETYSATSIKNGVYAYVEDPAFEIMLVTFTDPYHKNNDGSAIYYTFVPRKFAETHPGKVDKSDCDSILENRFLKYLEEPAIKKTAYNANFERTTLAAYYDDITCPPEQWQCTMVLAATLGYPHSLEAVGEAMNLGEDKKKDRIGKELIRYFSAPVKSTKANNHRTRNLPLDNVDKWNLFKEYNRQDVVAEQAIYQKLKKYTPNEKEKAFWNMDQRINDRGIRVDVPFVRQIVTYDKEEQKRKLNEMRELTGLDNPNSASQLKAWLADHGAPEFQNSLRKEEVKEALDKGIYKNKPEVETVLRDRLETAKSSTKKYYTMLNTKNRDDRCRGMFQFYGASRTGRWAGRRLQLQNLAKNHIEDLDKIRAAVAEGDWESVRKKYPDTADIESQLVRTALIPSEGCRFIVTDFSAIEARVIAWVAGEKWRLEAFENGDDIYCVSASKIFGVPVEKHGRNAELRAQGKVVELACIARGSLVQTNHGLIPIQDVTTNDLVWDGENYVSHEGVIDKGIREVMTYGGLTATFDHKVYVEEREDPCLFGIAAMKHYHLIYGANTGILEMDVPMGKRVQVYDIKNAGPNHRYFVQNCLVHNCGYGGGVNAMKRMDFAHVINDDKKYRKIVRDWREASPNIVHLWKRLEDKICDVLDTDMACEEASPKDQNKPESFPIPNTDVKLEIKREDDNLWIKLPSGRSICYPHARAEKNELGKYLVTFQGTDLQGKMCRIETYGGKLTENVVQAIARDCLAEKMLEAENRGYHVVAHIHDEMILDVPNDEHFDEAFQEIDALMAEPIDWAPGLPLKGGTYTCDYYMKD